MMGIGPLDRRRAESGAAAVEFALVMPILFLVVFGILQYGLYFFDTLGTRQGVREAARMGVVENFGSTACSTGTSPQKLQCVTKEQIDAITGDAYVKVKAPNGWVKGKALVVCAMVDSEGAVGLLPMPDNGIIATKTQMSIEKTSTTTFAETADTLPGGPQWTGVDWAWC
jgi:Flp pilus assembly pilin Flp